MNYIPIIKLKYNEILRAKYIRDYLSHPSIIPFLELRFELNKLVKNKCIDNFIIDANISKYFLGIPHKPEVIGKGDKLDPEDYLTRTNSTIGSYYNETIKLFSKEECVPVYYVYKDDDFIKLYDFLDYGHDLGRNVAILTTPSYAKKIKKEKIKNEDFLFLDLYSDTIKTHIPNLREILANFLCNIVLIRENRTRNTYNSVIELDKNAPLYNDLSNELTDQSLLFVKSSLFGFGDFCGFKNDINIGSQPIDSSEFYPAIALYQKQLNPNRFLGIRTSVQKDSGGFEDLKKLVIKRIPTLDPLNQTPLLSFLANEKTENYAAWNIITQWYYIAVMSIHDSWKN